MPGHRELQIIGHRGASGHAPENTEAALAAGLRAGAGVIEVDVQFAADGVPVVFHDRGLERMAGVRGRIRDQTARELSGYDVGFKSGDDFRGLRILTLEEAASLVPPRRSLHVEVKDYDAVTAAHLKEMLAVLRKRGGLDRCVATSFSEKVLDMLRGLEGKLRRGLLVTGRPKGWLKHAVQMGCTSLHPPVDETEASLVASCREAGMQIFPYTANEEGQLRRLVSLGVDGIYTDYPDRLASILGAGHPSAEPAEVVTAPPEPASVAVAARTAAPVVRPAAPVIHRAAPVVRPTPGPPAAGRPPRKKRRRRGGRGGGLSQGPAGPASEPAGPAAGAPARTPAPAAAPEPFGEAAPEVPASEGSDRKKRRRGRRGGRRERARRMRREQKPGGTDAPPPEGEPGPEGGD